MARPLPAAKMYRAVMDFRRIDPAAARIVMLEAGPHHA